MLSLLPYLTSILRAPLNSTEWKLLPLYPQELQGINSPNSSGLNHPSRVPQYLSVPTFTTKREGGHAFEKNLTRPCKDQGTEFWPCLFSHDGWEGVGGGRTCKASFSQCQRVSLYSSCLLPVVKGSYCPDWISVLNISWSEGSIPSFSICLLL